MKTCAFGEKLELYINKMDCFTAGISPQQRACALIDFFTALTCPSEPFTEFSQVTNRTDPD